jgi:hypothetical protein
MDLDISLNCTFLVASLDISSPNGMQSLIMSRNYKEESLEVELSLDIMFSKTLNGSSLVLTPSYYYHSLFYMELSIIREVLLEVSVLDMLLFFSVLSERIEMENDFGCFKKCKGIHYQ